jgi:hypothetical protein
MMHGVREGYGLRRLTRRRGAMREPPPADGEGGRRWGEGDRGVTLALTHHALENPRYTCSEWITASCSRAIWVRDATRPPQFVVSEAVANPCARFTSRGPRW